MASCTQRPRPLALHTASAVPRCIVARALEKDPAFRISAGDVSTISEVADGSTNAPRATVRVTAAARPAHRERRRCITFSNITESQPTTDWHRIAETVSSNLKTFTVSHNRARPLYEPCAISHRRPLKDSSPSTSPSSWRHVGRSRGYQRSAPLYNHGQLRLMTSVRSARTVKVDGRIETTFSRRKARFELSQASPSC